MKNHDHCSVHGTSKESGAEIACRNRTMLLSACHVVRKAVLKSHDVVVYPARRAESDVVIA